MEKNPLPGVMGALWVMEFTVTSTLPGGTSEPAFKTPDKIVGPPPSPMVGEDSEVKVGVALPAAISQIPRPWVATRKVPLGAWSAMSKTLTRGKPVP